MKCFAAFTLLLATAAFGQQVSENELSYGPFTSGPRDRSIAAAVAPHGILIAWSEADPDTQRASIRTALFDLDGQLIGAVNPIPTARANHQATGPVLATDGETFFLVWTERDPYSYTPRLLAGVKTNGVGKPIEAVQQMGAPRKPALVWDGVSYKLHDDRGHRVPFANPDANGWIDWSPGVKPVHAYPWGSRPGRPFSVHWAIVTADWIRSGTWSATTHIGNAPVVSAEGSELLIVWSTDDGLEGLRVVDGRAGDRFQLDSVFARDTWPAIGGRLVVFAKDGDVYGSLVTGSVFGVPFPISAGEEVDELPQAYPLGHDRYLVTYVRSRGATIELVGRFVDTSL